ncbi:hypothetical protein [Streptomyces sp. NPDC051909]|uniref:hypothetical protein n=1 Tax=Streptomyces sp. NPDC051909 TaxID=3154944 RepID=UPI003419EEDC
MDNRSTRLVIIGLIAGIAALVAGIFCAATGDPINDAVKSGAYTFVVVAGLALAATKDHNSAS